MRRPSRIEYLAQDVRYAIRLLTKNPGFTTTAVLALAIGIGINIAMFSVINSVVLRPLSYLSADRLVTLWKCRFPGGGVNASPTDFLAWRDQTRSFSAVAAYWKQSVNFGDAAQVPLGIDKLAPSATLRARGTNPNPLLDKVLY